MARYARCGGGDSMTAKQAEVWSLYKSGHRVVDIARITGRSKGNVSDTIKLIKTRMQNPPIKNLSRVRILQAASPVH